MALAMLPGRDWLSSVDRGVLSLQHKLATDSPPCRRQLNSEHRACRQLVKLTPRANIWSSSWVAALVHGAGVGSWTSWPNSPGSMSC